MAKKSWHISRRRMLRGLGVSMSLPLLDAMQPTSALGATGTRSPKRMACLFMPNGVLPAPWTPKVGPLRELPKTLSPLQKVRNQVLVLSELRNKNSLHGEGHHVKTAGLLTGYAVKKGGDKAIHNSISIDQLAARYVGKNTLLPSMELGCEGKRTGLDMGFSRIYGSHISWKDANTPMLKETNPRSAFDRMFRSSASRKSRANADNAGQSEKTDEQSLLDSVLADAKSLRSKLGGADQRKIDEYLEAVRSVEKRMQKHTKKIAPSKGSKFDIRKITPPKDRPSNHQEHVRLLLDMIVLGFWSDTTRVSTFMFGNAVSGINMSFIDGVKGGHHQISHHNRDKEKVRQYQLINQWHVAQLAYMLEKMNVIEDGDGRSLLDNSMILFASGIRDGNRHDPNNLPILLCGKGGGTLKPGRHIQYAKHTPLCNLHLALLRRLGIPAKRFGDSSGPLKGLS